MAEAALPLDHVIMGVVRGPRAGDRTADPTTFAQAVLRPDAWAAWATGPLDGDEAAGIGESPHAALYNLAKRLAEIRGTVSG